MKAIGRAVAALPLPDRMDAYYRFHSRIYDLTRWSFLFGRRRLVRSLPGHIAPRRILEVGCGTGENLVALAKIFPRASFIGVDVCEAMLARARDKTRGLGANIKLVRAAYDARFRARAPFDLIVFSYCLTMMNPGWEEALDKARSDLADKGVIAVVDFHNSDFAWFDRWMAMNHVRMDGKLPDALDRRFLHRRSEIHRAYGFAWRYFLYIGGK